MAILLYARSKRARGKDEIEMFRDWLRRYMTNAAHCDAIGMELLGPSLEREPDAAEFLRWASAKELWVPRGTLAAFSKAAREGRHRDAIRELVTQEKQDPERNVRNAAEWLERLQCL